FPGLSINGFVNAPNAGIVFFPLKPFDERKRKEESGLAIAGARNAKLGGIQNAFFAVFPPPPVNGLGQVGGFKLELEDRAGLGEAALNAATQRLLGRAWQTRALAGVFSGYRVNVRQLEVEVDREKVKREGIVLTDL